VIAGKISRAGILIGIGLGAATRGKAEAAGEITAHLASGWYEHYWNPLKKVLTT
jgi:hypothetical protein